MATKKKKIAPQLEEVVTENPVKLDFTKSTKNNNIPDSALINVKSNVFGELIFIDPVTKERISWPNCGSVQQLPMVTLRHMKTGAIKFFTNQLVVMLGFADENSEKFEVEDIYNSLYVSQYYKDFLDPSDYEQICAWTPEEIEDRVKMLSKATRVELVVALNTYIEKGVLDSIKTIKAFEKALNCELSKPE